MVKWGKCQMPSTVFVFVIMCVVTIIFLVVGNVRLEHVWQDRIMSALTRVQKQAVRESFISPLPYRGERNRTKFFQASWDQITPSDPFWQSVDDDLDVLTYSAHYDDVEQPPIIRVIAAARYPLTYSDVVCRYHGCHGCPVLHRVSSKVKHNRPPSGRKRIAAFVVCPIPATKHEATFLPSHLSLRKDICPSDRSSNKSSPSPSSSSSSSCSSSSSSNSSYIQAPTRPFPIHYSNATVSWYRARVEELMKRLSIVPEEGDVPDFIALGELVTQSRHGQGKENDSLEVAALKLPFASRTRRRTLKPAAGTSGEKATVQGLGSSQVNLGDKPHSGYRWNLTRCFPAFFKKMRESVMLAEMVTASRAMGVDHFLFYSESATPNFKAILQVLQARGWAEVLPWNLHVPDREIFYKGQFPAINDCLFRTQRSSRYVMSGDVDELFVDLSHNQSLVSLLDDWFAKNPECGAFLFLNTFFNSTYIPPPSDGASNSVHNIGSNTGSSSNNGRSSTNTTKAASKSISFTNTTNINPVPSLFSLAKRNSLFFFLHTEREKRVYEATRRSKPAINPRRVAVGSVHIVGRLRPGFKSCVMDQREGLLFHFRRAMVPNKYSPSTRENDIIRRRLGPIYVPEAVAILKEAKERLKADAKVKVKVKP